MEETTQEPKKTSFSDKIGCGFWYVFFGFIYVAWAIDFLYGTPVKRIVGFIMLVVFLLFTGALLNIKPLKMAFHYFIKMLTPIMKLILKVIYEIISAIVEGVKKIFGGIPYLLGMVGLIIIAVVIFAIVKWAFNYVF